MDFYAILDQAITLLRQRQRVTYRALPRQFDLDEATLSDLKDELLYAHPQVRDDAGHGLVWTEDAVPATVAPAQRAEQAPLAYTPPYLAEKILTSRSALEGECKQACFVGTGLLALRQGALSSALPLLERAVDLCQDTDLPVFFPRQAVALGAAYILSGRVTDAVQLLTPAMEQTSAMAMVIHQVLCRLSLGAAYLLGGRLEEAHALAEETLALTRARQERCHQGYALRLLAEIAAHHTPPDVAQAEAHYHQALAQAEELGMRPLVAHCNLGLGTLYTRTGQQEPARTALSAAIDLYRAMEMTFWLPQAEAALAQIEAQ